MKKTLEISGMSCGHCVHAVRAALEGLENVQVEDVRIGSASVVVTEAVSEDTLRGAVEEEGYAVVSVS